MRFQLKKFIIVFSLLSCVGSISCTTTEINSSEMPSPPAYTKVPHPNGTDVGDLVLLFTDEKAPKGEDFVKTCDEGYLKLKVATQSKLEFDQGVRELVKQEPVHFHWCFYGRMLGLENEVKSLKFIDEKQKLVLDQFDFMVPIARAFFEEFHDSRYLRWATLRYRKLSEVVFYRKLNLTPAGTLELVQPESAFGLWRQDHGSSPSILEKYHLTQHEDLTTATSGPGADLSSSFPRVPSSLLSPLDGQGGPPADSGASTGLPTNPGAGNSTPNPTQNLPQNPPQNPPQNNQLPVTPLTEEEMKLLPLQGPNPIPVSREEPLPLPTLYPLPVLREAPKVQSNPESKAHPEPAPNTQPRSSQLNGLKLKQQAQSRPLSPPPPPQKQPDLPIQRLPASSAQAQPVIRAQPPAQGQAPAQTQPTGQIQSRPPQKAAPAKVKKASPPKEPAPQEQTDESAGAAQSPI